MDEDLIRRTRVAAHSLDAPRERLLGLLTELGAAGNGPETHTMVIDRDELASLLLAVALPPSFGDALRVEGFRHATGAKIAPRRIHPRIPYAVTHCPPEQTDGAS